MKQRIDGHLSQKAQAVWGPKAMVVVIEERVAIGVDLAGRANAIGKRERWELHRGGHMVPVVVVGSSFKQARQGVAALCRNARARTREKGQSEKG